MAGFRSPNFDPNIPLVFSALQTIPHFRQIPKTRVTPERTIFSSNLLLIPKLLTPTIQGRTALSAPVCLLALNQEELDCPKRRTYSCNPSRRLSARSVTAIAKTTLNRRHKISAPLLNSKKLKHLVGSQIMIRHTGTSPSHAAPSREAAIVTTTPNRRLPILCPLRNPQKQRRLQGVKNKLTHPKNAASRPSGPGPWLLAPGLPKNPAQTPARKAAPNRAKAAPNRPDRRPTVINYRPNTSSLSSAGEG